MQVIKRATLKGFWEQKNCGDAQGPLEAWFSECERHLWYGQYSGQQQGCF